MYIFSARALASCRRRPLSLYVRPHKLSSRLPTALALALCALTSAKATDTSAARESTICEMVADPVPLQGVRLRFNAQVISDGIHASLLSDPTCNRGISFDLSAAGPPSQVKKVDEFLASKFALGTKKEMSAEFEASLRRLNRTDGLFPYTLEVHKIAKLKLVVSEKRDDQ